MEYAKNNDMKKSESRAKKVKNLEEMVESIFFQDESDEDRNANVDKSGINSKAPSRSNRIIDVATPRDSQIVIDEFSQTPRRSCRKSIKPTQDYEDIVNKSLRVSTRSAKKQLLVTKEDFNENHDAEIVQPKWTPAKVGRVSQKRSRKSKRSVKEKKQDDIKTKQLREDTISDKEYKYTEEDVEIVENVENINPIVKQNENSETGNNIKHQDDYNVEINKNLLPIAYEVKEEDLSEKYQNNEIDNRSLIVECVDNVKHLNMIIECKDCQDKEKQKQHEADYEMDDESKDTNESIHIMQEDSEDFQKLTEKHEQKEIRIIYESNISNREIKEESEQAKPLSRGISSLDIDCYIKSEINISDLGLTPLKDEEEGKFVIQNEKKHSSQEVEEMPSLIVCEDDDEEIAENAEPYNKLNETFEANDSVIVVEEVMETLQFSDDGGETPRKRVRIVVTNTELQENLILSTPERSFGKVKLPSTPKTLTPKLRVPPKQKTTPFRFPTPYRGNKNFKFSEVKENIINNPNKHVSITTLEPKEIVLRGIRKRSLSVCIDGNDQKRQKFLAGSLAKVKQDRMVSFYSPANKITYTDDLDKWVEKNLKKKKPQKELPNQFITTRRKRSLSLDESISVSLASKLPRPVVSQNRSTTVSHKPLSRTKLPNFSAIHQKQFKKMENLVEHVSRKQERSKNLINSTTKLKPASAQKKVCIIKNSNNISTVKPKAIKKIDLGTFPQMNKLLNTTFAPPDVSETTKIKKLPDPRLAIVKPMKSESISRKPQHHQQQIRKYLKPSQTENMEKAQLNSKRVALSKPVFNLSTSLLVKPATSSSTFIEKPNTSHTSSSDKVNSRLQRHMDLFKGRVQSTKTGIISRKNEAIVKGVRSNRRFELQMQHRKNFKQ